MIKSLTPFTKFLIFILTMVAALITNDTRFLGVLALIALTCFISAKLKSNLNSQYIRNSLHQFAYIYHTYSCIIP